MIKNLLAIRLSSFLSSRVSIGKSKAKKNGAMLSAVIVYLILAACFALIATSTAYMMAGIMIAMKMEWLYFAIFNIMSFSMVFVFSVFETKSILFDCNDNELLLSMPILPRDIVISRILTVLVINYVESFIVMIPAIVVFAIFGGGVIPILGGIITSVLIPLFATSLSAGVGYIVTVISKKLGNSTFSNIISYVVFLVIYFIGYDWLVSSMNALEQNPADFVEGASASLSVFKGIGEASLLHPVPLLVLAAVSLGIALITFFVISVNYTAIITKTAKTKRTKYVKRELKQSSAVIALSSKEISRFLSSATYIMNGGIGSIMQIAFGALILINSADVLFILQVLGEQLGVSLDGVLPIVLTMVSVMISSMNFTAASALSLEGDNLWIIATSPVGLRSIIYAKLVPQLMLTLPANLITSVLIAIAVKANFLELAFVMIVPILAALAFAMLALAVNIALPKFDYESEAQVVKQSMAATVSVFGGMIIGMTFIAISIIASIELGALAAQLILTLAFIAVFSASYLILTGPCERRLEKILRGR